MDRIRTLVAEVVQRGMVPVEDLRSELENGCSRGSALPRAVLKEVSTGVRSAAEGWARQLAARTGLPEPRWNVAIYDEAGEFVAIPDARFDDVGLAWEIDSYEFHLSPADYSQTLRRHTAMAVLGIEVLHTLPGRLRSEPKTVAAELRQMYAIAAARPRPSVRMRL